MPLPNPHTGPARPASLLPAADHVQYLASLLTVMAILYAAWSVSRQQRRSNRLAPQSVGTADVPVRGWGN